MYIAISTLKLVLLIIGSFLYFIGNGWSAISFVLHKRTTVEHIHLPRLIPLAFVSGLIINLGITLCVQSIQTGLLLGSIIALSGLIHISLHVYRIYRNPKVVFGSTNWWIAVAFTSVVFLGPIIGTPIEVWDARSIWFFHAKMIYIANNIGTNAGWQHASVIFSHPDYPKLLSLLAAQIAYIVGFWNEYIPKLALFILLVPAFIWLFNFSKWSFSFFTLLLLIPFSFYDLLWIGYMDSFLALYFALTMLFLGRYLKSSSPMDLFSGLGSMVLLLYLKNEGILAFLLTFSLGMLIFYLQKRLTFSKIFVFNNWRYFFVSFLMLSPLFVWSLYKNSWGISNDLKIGTSDSIQNAIIRLTDGSYKFIFEASYKRLEPALLLIGILIFASFVWKKALPKGSYLPLSVAFFYYLGMVVIYLLTPYNLRWHVKSSITRTMLSVSANLFIGAYFMLSEIEKEYIHTNHQTDLLAINETADE